MGKNILQIKNKHDDILSESILFTNDMTYTLLPSIKGQITLPPAIRIKYGIGKNTPIVLEDKENWVINIKIMQMVDYNNIKYFENEKEIKLSFTKAVDPQIIIDKIDNRG